LSFLLEWLPRYTFIVAAEDKTEGSESPVSDPPIFSPEGHATPKVLLWLGLSA